MRVYVFSSGYSCHFPLPPGSLFSLHEYDMERADHSRSFFLEQQGGFDHWGV